MLNNKIPIGIKTCKNNYIKQQAVKDTWFNSLDKEKYFPVFLIGDNSIQSEYSLIDNILYINCDDSYTGLSGKLKKYYKWCLENFSSSHFFTCDDDSYINTNLFNHYTTFYQYDYLGFFLYGIDKIDNKSGYTSGCAVCVSRRCADACSKFLPDIADDRHYDDIIVGDIINENITDVKKYHETLIHPWSNCKKIDNLLFGHYIYHKINEINHNLNDYQMMKQMHYLYNHFEVDEKINLKLFLTGRYNINFIYHNNLKTETSYSVPKKIHFIWIGSTIPEKYINNIINCKKINTNYEIYLHTDQEFSNILIDYNIICYNIYYQSITDKQKEFVSKLKKTINKADILRYQIVYNFGGVYSDIDSIFIKPYDIIEKSFVTHIDGYNNISNAFFGFGKNSNFLNFILLNAYNKDITIESDWPLFDPGFFTSCFVAYNDTNIKTIHQNYFINNSKYSYSYQTNDKNW